jgi:hypothetical protein
MHSDRSAPRRPRLHDHVIRTRDGDFSGEDLAAILAVPLFIAKFLRDDGLGRRNNFTVRAPNPLRVGGRAWAITKSATEWKERRDPIERYSALEP